MTSRQEEIEKFIDPLLEIGRRYEVKDLVKLLENSDYEIPEEGLKSNPSEPGRKKYKTWVKNAVRGSENRTEFTYVWPGLKNIKGHKNLYYKQSKNAMKEDIVTQPKDKEDDDGSGIVYAISNNAWENWIKIGMTSDFKKRLGAYQMYSPFKDYKEIHKVEVSDRGAAEEEAHYKAYNLSNKQSGEWFKITEEEAIKVLDNLNEKEASPRNPIFKEFTGLPFSKNR